MKKGIRICEPPFDMYMFKDLRILESIVESDCERHAGRQAEIEITVAVFECRSARLIPHIFDTADIESRAPMIRNAPDYTGMQRYAVSMIG